MSRLLCRNKSIELLEPYEGKLSCTVLRGERGSNAPDLPDLPGSRQQLCILLTERNVPYLDANLIRFGMAETAHARPDGGRTPAPVATLPPAFELSPLPDHHLQIHYYAAGTDSRKRGKPDGQHGVEIRWIFSDVPVTDANDLSNSVFDTATPAILPFSGHDHGRSIYLTLRWENTRGEKGPWSPIVQTYVP